MSRAKSLPRMFIIAKSLFFLPVRLISYHTVAFGSLTVRTLTHSKQRVVSAGLSITCSHPAVVSV